MIIEYTLAFIIGTASGLFGTYLWFKRKQTLKKQLEEFDKEEQLVDKLRSSDTEYNRWFMESLLSVLFLICIANLSTTLVTLMRLLPAYPAETIIPLVCWGAGSIICVQEIARSRNIRFSKRFSELLSKKREKVKIKISNLS